MAAQGELFCYLFYIFKGFLQPITPSDWLISLPSCWQLMDHNENALTASGDKYSKSFIPWTHALVTTGFTCCHMNTEMMCQKQYKGGYLKLFSLNVHYVEWYTLKVNVCNLLARHAVISIRFVACVCPSHALFLVSAILYVHMLSHPTSSDFIWEAIVCIFTFAVNCMC